MVTYGSTLLRIDHISLSYGDKVILKDVNAEIKKIEAGAMKGQVVGFLGPSGIGKTQMFRIIAGLHQPTSGQVILNGGIPVHPGLVGVVAQDYPLFWHRTIWSNLIMAARRKEKNKKAAEEKVKAYLDHFELLERADLYPVQLSGGQRQRCAIIQQILCSDHFLLMDEPFSGLDLLMLDKTASLIQQVANMDELNTIIVVSHDVTTTASVADHLWLMGRDHDEKGNPISGSHIVETYDLIARDLCWHSGIITEPRFLSFVAEVKNRFRAL